MLRWVFPHHLITFLTPLTAVVVLFNTCRRGLQAPSFVALRAFPRASLPKPF